MWPLLEEGLEDYFLRRHDCCEGSLCVLRLEGVALLGGGASPVPSVVHVLLDAVGAELGRVELALELDGVAHLLTESWCMHLGQAVSYLLFLLLILFLSSRCVNPYYVYICSIFIIYLTRASL